MQGEGGGVSDIWSARARDVHAHDVVHPAPILAGGMPHDMSIMNKTWLYGVFRSQIH